VRRIAPKEAIDFDFATDPKSQICLPQLATIHLLSSKSRTGDRWDLSDQSLRRDIEMFHQ
jgi:hypothetical protein